MLASRLIPCLDVDCGRVRKGVRFQNLRDAGDPAEVAARYGEQNADELAVLDISASHEGRKTTVDLIDRIATQVFIPLLVGGGISELADIRALLRVGADKVSINTAAVANPEFVRAAAQSFGTQCIVAAIDAKQVGTGKWEVFTHGGRKPTGLDAIEWARRLCDLGAGEILLTCMDSDGTSGGFNIPLVRAVSEAVPVPVIASGGAGTPQHLAEGILQGKADAVLAAGMFHFGHYSIGEAKEHMRSAGITVR